MSTWKSIINKAIQTKAIFDFRNRVIMDSFLFLFANIQLDPETCDLWNFSRSYCTYLPYYRTTATVSAKLFTYPYIMICPKGRVPADEHVILFCPVNSVFRYNLLHPTFTDRRQKL